MSPQLNLFKCPIYVDYDGTQAIGHISTDGDLALNNYAEYTKCLSYSPFDIDECRDCKVLPIYHGKCPVLWELSGRSKDEGCIPEKHSIEEKVRYALKNPEQMSSLIKSGILRLP